jgi:hypothetical protein
VLRRFEIIRRVAAVLEGAAAKPSCAAKKAAPGDRYGQ